MIPLGRVCYSHKKRNTFIGRGNAIPRETAQEWVKSLNKDYSELFTHYVEDIINPSIDDYKQCNRYLDAVKGGREYIKASPLASKLKNTSSPDKNTSKLDASKEIECIICLDKFTQSQVENLPCSETHPYKVCTSCKAQLARCPLCNK